MIVLGTTKYTDGPSGPTLSEARHRPCASCSSAVLVQTSWPTRYEEAGGLAQNGDVLGDVPSLSLIISSRAGPRKTVRERAALGILMNCPQGTQLPAVCV